MASPASSIRLLAEECRSLAFGSIGAGYTGIGTAFDHPIRVLIIQNFTDATLWFSLDGIDNHLPLLANGYMILDISSNKVSSQGFYVAEGDRIYVKQLTIPTLGSVYVSAFYGKE